MQRIGWLRLTYWLYLGLGGLAMLVVSLIAEQTELIVLSAGVVAVATWRLLSVRRDPDD